jgi:dGTPase
MTIFQQLTTPHAPTQERWLAPYASRAKDSRGRLYPEPESPTRTCFQRDRDRIIHSAAFRRLQYKTQVFVNHEGDFFRTRLTHSLEVAQIARSACRTLGLDEDLGESLALAHDLGHTPFGHAGEDALKVVMRPYGGFDHNSQSLRVVTRLEQHYPRFDGLNLTWETLEGLVKHNGPLSVAGQTDDLPRAIVDYAEQQDLELHTHAGPEAQVAALADDIAYNNHDIDDGLRAGLFSIEDLDGVALVGPLFEAARSAYPDIERTRLIDEAVRQMIGVMVGDLTAETARSIRESGAETAAEIRAMKTPVAVFSDEMHQHDKALKDFLHSHMYRHYKLNRMTSKARRVVTDLFELLVAEPECLPTEWRGQAAGPGDTKTAQIVSDYIAGMTDRYALDEHRRLYDVQARTS